MAKRSEGIESLQSLRNIGPVIAAKLYAIGVNTPEQLKRAEPEELYGKLKMRAGGKLDRCVLYVLRGAVLDIPWPQCKNQIIKPMRR